MRHFVHIRFVERAVHLRFPHVHRRVRRIESHLHADIARDHAAAGRSIFLTRRRLRRRVGLLPEYGIVPAVGAVIDRIMVISAAVGERIDPHGRHVIYVLKVDLVHCGIGLRLPISVQAPVRNGLLPASSRRRYGFVERDIPLCLGISALKGAECNGYRETEQQGQQYKNRLPCPFQLHFHLE